MTVRRLDSSGDWAFGKGQNDYLKDESAIAQNIRTRLLSWRDDCFFALAEGVNWRERLDIGQKDGLVDEIKNVILKTVGVVGVTDVIVNFDSAARFCSIQYAVSTIFTENLEGFIQGVI